MALRCCAASRWSGMLDPRLFDGRREGKRSDIDKIKMVHDAEGQTLTVWLDEPSEETVCDEMTEEVVLMKGVTGRVIGFETLHYRPADAKQGFVVEVGIRSAA